MTNQNHGKNHTWNENVILHTHLYWKGKAIPHCLSQTSYFDVFSSLADFLAMLPLKTLYCLQQYHANPSRIQGMG